MVGGNGGGLYASQNSMTFAQSSSLSGQKIVPNNCRNDFEYFLRQYCSHANEKGDVYTWGSGEMGQLGYSSKVIQIMPKDREGYPFQVIHNLNTYVAKSFRDRIAEEQRDLLSRRW
jgi:alpha-tubulin suppressor-like RCC1 family protein